MVKVTTLHLCGSAGQDDILSVFWGFICIQSESFIQMGKLFLVWGIVSIANLAGRKEKVVQIRNKWEGELCTRWRYGISWDGSVRIEYFQDYVRGKVNTNF